MLFYKLIKYNFLKTNFVINFVKLEKTKVLVSNKSSIFFFFHFNFITKRCSYTYFLFYKNLFFKSPFTKKVDSFFKCLF